MKITKEMEDLEKIKIFHAQMMRLNDLKISKLKGELNLKTINEEIALLGSRLQTSKVEE